MQTGMRDQLVEVFGFALEEQHILRVEDRGRSGRVSPKALAHDSDDGDVSLLHGFEGRHRAPDRRRSRRHDRLRGVAFDGEGRVHGRGRPSLGEQPPTDGQEGDAAQGDGETDGRVIKHAERFAEHVGTDLGDDDVR